MTNDVRDEIITAIIDAGFYGRKRDWSLGKSIVCARTTDVDIDGLAILVDVVTLIPKENNTWLVQYSGFKSDDATTTTEVITHLRHVYADNGLVFSRKVGEAMRRIGRNKLKPT